MCTRLVHEPLSWIYSTNSQSCFQISATCGVPAFEPDLAGETHFFPCLFDGMLCGHGPSVGRHATQGGIGRQLEISRLADTQGPQTAQSEHFRTGLFCHLYLETFSHRDVPLFYQRVKLSARASAAKNAKYTGPIPNITRTTP